MAAATRHSQGASRQSGAQHNPMTRRPPSLRRLAILLTLPVLVLAGMGVWVVIAERAQERSALLRQSEEVLDSAEWVDTSPGIHGEIDACAVFLPGWVVTKSEPPPPPRAYGEVLEAQQALREGQRDKALRLLSALRQNQEVANSFSENGIPLLQLVEHLWLQLEPEGDRAAQALVWAAVRQPSILTTRLAEEACALLPPAAAATWRERAVSAQALLETVLRGGKAWGWHLSPGSSEDPGSLICTPLAEAASRIRRMATRGLNAPSPFGLAVVWRDQPICSSQGDVIATRTLYPWEFTVTLAQPAILAEKVSRRTSILAWAVSGAVLVVALAMWLTYRAFKKQAELSRLQSEFVASVSHELRTPVASIGVLAERLECGKADVAQVAEYHRFIAREGRRLAGLVDNVLDFSRIERGAKAYDLEPTDLPRLVRETAALMRPHAEEKGLTLTEEIHDVPERLWPPVDAVAIRQALVNLLDNAIKFTPAGGTVTVGFAVDRSVGSDQSVCLYVRDTGIGIPTSEYARIFDRFHRVDNGLRRETTGAGIGLSIVKHIAEAHGAKVIVASEARQGAVFTIHFQKRMKDES
jgi:signal transduction histidine kinase